MSTAWDIQSWLAQVALPCEVAQHSVFNATLACGVCHCACSRLRSCQFKHEIFGHLSLVTTTDEAHYVAARFAGWRESFDGDLQMYGKMGVQFFTRTKVGDGVKGLTRRCVLRSARGMVQAGSACFLQAFCGGSPCLLRAHP